MSELKESEVHLAKDSKEGPCQDKGGKSGFSESSLSEEKQSGFFKGKLCLVTLPELITS